ncbi:hypothetical protein BH09PLA1_BH09PLA1_11140 [soil metagenome]
MLCLGLLCSMVLGQAAPGVFPSSNSAPATINTKYADITAALNYSGLQPGQQAVIAVALDMHAGYHAQSHAPKGDGLIATEITIEENPDITVYAPVYPPGKDVKYEALGELNVYTGKSIIFIPIEVKAGAAAAAVVIRGSITYQVCDDQVCFQPETNEFTVSTRIVTAGETVAPASPELFANFDPSIFSKLVPIGSAQPARAAGGAELSVFGIKLASNSYALVFSAALLVGLIFNVMPCVLPVLPLKALGFYEVSQHRRGKAFALGLMFSVGLVSAFAVLALLILVGGQNWGELFSRGWFVWGMTIVLVLFAMSTWGLFTFRLPVGVYSFEPRHDTYSGNFLFGGMTALLSTPCTAPIFPALLAWAALQPKWIGTGVIVTVGIGMSLPYLILSAMPELARKLPRTGPWSELVKQMMGFLILGVAAYFAGLRLFRGNEYMWLVFAVALVAAIFLIVQTARLLPRAIPIAISIILALAMCGGTFALAKAFNRPGLWTYYSSEVFETSRKSGEIVLVKFTAAWCQNCQYVEQTVYTDQAALDALKKHRVVMIKADLTRSEAPGWPLLKKLNPSGGIPLTAIYFPDAPEPKQLTSIYTSADLINALER